MSSCDTPPSECRPDFIPRQPPPKSGNDGIGVVRQRQTSNQADAYETRTRLLWSQSIVFIYRYLEMAERVGFEPTCRLPDKTLSRRPRYDHFGTSPVVCAVRAGPARAGHDVPLDTIGLKPDSRYVAYVPDCRTFNYTCRPPGPYGVASRAACRRPWKNSCSS